MTKTYCKNCKILLFENTIISWLKEKPKTTEYYEYEDGYYCKICSIKKRTHPKQENETENPK